MCDRGQVQETFCRGIVGDQGARGLALHTGCADDLRHPVYCRPGLWDSPRDPAPISSSPLRVSKVSLLPAHSLVGRSNTVGGLKVLFKI